MLRFDNQFLKWLAIGALAAVVADAILYPFELLIVAQRDAGALPPTVAFATVALTAAILTIGALLVVGERAWAGMLVAAIAAVIAYLIGATHLAALSLGVSVATIGDRRQRERVVPRRASRAPVAPVEPRPASRRRRRRRR
jgi:O-antigen ligase